MKFKGKLIAVAVLTAALPSLVGAQADPCLPEAASPQQSANYWLKSMVYNVIDFNGTKVLFAEGGVGQAEGANMARALAANPGVDEVWLSSPGGVLVEGMAMGRALRKSGLMVRVPQGRVCASSCTIAFLGGTVRSVDEGGLYGVHMFSLFFDRAAALKYTQSMIDTALAYQKVNKRPASERLQVDLMALEQDNARLAGQLAKYLTEMSASLEFLSGMFGQKQLGICFLTRAAIDRYNVANTD